MDALEHKNEAQEDKTVEKIETKETTSPQEEEKTTASVEQMTLPQLCEHLQTLLQQENIDSIKEDVEQTRQCFYKKNQAEITQQRLTYEENGGEEKNFIPVVSPIEEEFKKLLSQYKEQKAKYTKALTQQKEQNLLKKRHIVEQIKKLTETHEDVSSNITVFRNLQQEWKETGSVPATDANDLWREYNKYQEDFWDLIKINNELREYDFKKNKEAKTILIEQAIALDSEPDVVKAFKALQELHDEWRETGPVSRDDREEMWTKFKEASTTINKKHQAHFEALHAMEAENLEKKTALCEQLETISTEQLGTFKEWDAATKQIIALQEEWRKIGFAPRKENRKIYQRYRTICDNFFSQKSDFFKEIKKELNENLEKKKILCEKAESLKDSSEWKETGDQLTQLQKEWKKIGPIPRKYSDALWNRFIDACDAFFKRRNENMSDQRKAETENLKKKKEIIERIEKYEKQENGQNPIDDLRAFIASWNQIGHVPFKEKDDLHKAYRQALDKQYDILNLDAAKHRLEAFKTDLIDKGDKKMEREKRRLLKIYDNLKSEINSYERNLSLFTISSKKGKGMLGKVEQKIDKLKDEASLITKKIKIIEKEIERQNQEE